MFAFTSLVPAFICIAEFAFCFMKHSTFGQVLSSYGAFVSDVPLV
jgi:hypothetical protein